MELTARDIARITSGELASGSPDAVATSYAIDSRALEPGACFVALVAARDGHEYVADAASRGAAVALVSRRVHVGEGSPIALVRVAEPLDGLGALGARARDALDGVPVVGITGSAGKTGTKDLTAAALAGAGAAVHASPGSYNNEAGVPLTLLDAPTDASAIVLEMGARQRGDIAALCAIAHPTVGVITNVGLAHAGRLGGPEGVALTKGELFEALPASGLGILDADDAATASIRARTRASVMLVSGRGTDGTDLTATDVVLDAELRPTFRLHTPWGSGTVALGVHGDHQVINALQAAAVALHLGVAFGAVVTGLESATPAEWRMEVVHGPDGLLVLNDAYNANPSSMAAAVRALAQLDTAGRRIAVLGEMLELGDLTRVEHERIGRLASELGIDLVVAVGDGTAGLADAARDAGTTVVTARDADDARRALLDLVESNDAVLVKGSRAVGLESVAHALAHVDGPGSSAAVTSERVP
ncbi:MAG: UDP-N-acetylmuramoyl-tripeptide--D-alanyl-D-alanine ligase [Acidimicrobiia bacterium]